MAVDMQKILDRLDHSTNFMCSKKDIPALTEAAKEEAERVLRDFYAIFRPARPVSIEIYTVEHPLCYSIGARLLWDGDDVIRDESCCDLLFIDLNQMILKRMTELGIPYVEKEERNDTLQTQ